MHFLCIGGAKGGAIVSLYQNGGYDEPLQMRLARSPQRSLHRPDLFPHTPAYDLFPCTADIHVIVSTHVETVVLLINQNPRPKYTVSIGIDADEYRKIKTGKNN